MIEGDAFYECIGLANIVLSENLTIIGYESFQGCTGLKKITIPGNVTSIGIYAFRGCSSLKDVTFGDSVTGIGYKAFDGTALINDETNWENGILYIGKYLIDTKKDISGECVIKEGTLCIAGEAFYNRSGLTGLIIPDSVAKIPSYSFSKCVNLKSVTIGNGVSSIGWGAFEYCSGITKLVIPRIIYCF